MGRPFRLGKIHEKRPETNPRQRHGTQELYRRLADCDSILAERFFQPYINR